MTFGSLDSCSCKCIQMKKVRIPTLKGGVVIKKKILFLIGLTPFLLGFLMNIWVMLDGVLPFKLIGILFLVFWATIGFISYKFEKALLKSAVIVHSPAFLMLLFMMYQEIILGQFWMNIFGSATQFFYLPLMNISVAIGGILSSLTPWAMKLWLISLIAFLLMLGSFYVGQHLNKRLNAQ